MFPNAAPTNPTRQTFPTSVSMTNWNVAVYRKGESAGYDSTQTQSIYASFYVQSISPSANRSDVLYFRYQPYQVQKQNPNSQNLPFTISQIDDFKLRPETAPVVSAGTSSSRFYNAEQQTVRINENSEGTPSLLLQARAFLGVLVLNTTSHNVRIIRPFLICVTEETHIGQLFDANIIRINQVATISLRESSDDEAYTAGIKKLFQGRCFYYSACTKSDSRNRHRYFDKPYDITLCAQRMIQSHDSDNRFFWNRALCLPLLRFNIDIRYWIPKIMCGGIEKSPRRDDIDLWLISRMSCERAGTRFNVRGVNDDGAVANFVETEQIVVIPGQRYYSSYVIVRGSIPIFWYQPRHQVGTHRITISRSEALSFKAFFEHFKHLYRHYGRIVVINLIEKGNQEKELGEEYEKLFYLLVRTYKDVQKNQKPIIGHLNERDFLWFEYHDQARSIKNVTPEQFVQEMFIENSRYPIQQTLQMQNVFTYLNDRNESIQKGVFRVNCIDCLDRTNNVQLTIGLNVLQMQLESLKRQKNSFYLREQLKEMWINNGDHVSRIYTGTGALNQRNLAKDIQRSVGRAIHNNLRDDDKQQAIQALIYTYAKDSPIHEWAVAALSTPYVVADASILYEMFKLRQRYVRKEKYRISIGTWNINGDKNPALEHEYPSILNAWILNGPDDPSTGYVNRNYQKSIPDILVIGFQEICDLTAANMVSASSVNARRWVRNVQTHFKRAFPNDEYIQLGDDQLVGVSLAVFIRRDLAPSVRNIAIDSVKTGMGGKLGNKGCVAIRLVLHNTSICFICAHFTAGQNEFNERNKDFKTIMEKLSFPPPSRAVWHDHIFFLGDFNYRLSIPRGQIEHFIDNGLYSHLMQYDQLKSELSAGRVFQGFNEGPIHFPPTYKFDVGSNVYDTSEKARIPSYTDRILWRSSSANAQAELLYYGRADVRTSDHRPVNAIFDVDVEMCDEMKLYQEYVGILEKFRPSNALVIFDMRSDLMQRKNQLFDEFESFVKRKYGSDIGVLDRFAQVNQGYLSLFMFFDNGEQARKVMIPSEDQLPSGIWFKKRLIDTNDDLALALKFNLSFANADETMYSESINYDLGGYQQPARESLSTRQDLDNDDFGTKEESTSFKGSNENFQQTKVDELMSFETEHPHLINSSSNPSFSTQSSNSSLFNDNAFDPLHFSATSTSSNKNIDTTNLFAFDAPVESTAKSTFYIDTFELESTPAISTHQNHSSVNIFASNSTIMNNNFNSQSTFYYQQPPAHMLPTRPAPPIPVAAAVPSVQTSLPRPVSLRNLGLNPFQPLKDEVNDDLLDLGDPGSPPPSPKFDPYG